MQIAWDLNAHCLPLIVVETSGIRSLMDNTNGQTINTETEFSILLKRLQL